MLPRSAISPQGTRTLRPAQFGILPTCVTTSAQLKQSPSNTLPDEPSKPESSPVSARVYGVKEYCPMGHDMQLTRVETKEVFSI